MMQRLQPLQYYMHAIALSAFTLCYMFTQYVILALAAGGITYVLVIAVLCSIRQRYLTLPAYVWLLVFVLCIYMPMVAMFFLSLVR